MTAAGLFDILTTRGITCTITEAGGLELDAPSGALDAELVAALRAHKPELLALLTDSPTAQNADATYVEEIALTVEMCRCCQALADVSPPTDRAAWNAAHARYQRKAEAVRAFGRTLDPAGRSAFHRDLRTRMYAIRDAWKAGQEGERQ